MYNNSLGDKNKEDWNWIKIAHSTQHLSVTDFVFTETCLKNDKSTVIKLLINLLCLIQHSLNDPNNIRGSSNDALNVGYVRIEFR